MTEAHPATTGPPVDLDAFDAFARDPYAGGHSPHEVADTFQHHALRLIAEVRAAREAIEELRSWRPTSHSQQALLAKYDQAVGGL